ncbi:MAG: replication initiation factor domain-containing protein [Candidatus Competibacteraceae bacterium]|nr:replication initiation factor domain-containing protein [Candidatus Competibacteraceae bacterium]
MKEQTLRDFGRYFVSINARCTRWDWAIDDYSRQLDIDTIYAHCESSRVSGFSNCKLIRALDARTKKRGDCLYLGATSSDRILRIYDKNVESRGEINAIRVELQARDTIAHSYFVDYFSTPEIGDRAQRTSMRAIGHYRFVEDTSEVLSRCPDVEWWADFVQRVGGRVKVAVRRLAPMLSDKKALGRASGRRNTVANI